MYCPRIVAFACNKFIKKYTDSFHPYIVYILCLRSFLCLILLGCEQLTFNNFRRTGQTDFGLSEVRLYLFRVHSGDWIAANICFLAVDTPILSVYKRCKCESS